MKLIKYQKTNNITKALILYKIYTSLGGLMFHLSKHSKVHYQAYWRHQRSNQSHVFIVYSVRKWFKFEKNLAVLQCPVIMLHLYLHMYISMTSKWTVFLVYKVRLRKKIKNIRINKQCGLVCFKPKRLCRNKIWSFYHLNMLWRL